MFLFSFDTLVISNITVVVAAKWMVVTKVQIARDG